MTIAPAWSDAVLLVARGLMAVMFVTSATDKFRSDLKEIAMIRGLHLPAPAALETLTGVFEVVAAIALLVGLGARIAAALLILFTGFTTLAFLRWWTPTTPAEARQSVRNAFFANAAVVGGLLYLATVGPGRWSLSPWS